MDERKGRRHISTICANYYFIITMLNKFFFRLQSPALTKTEKDAPVFFGPMIVWVDKDAACKFCCLTSIFIREILYTSFSSSYEPSVPSNQSPQCKKYPLRVIEFING